MSQLFFEFMQTNNKKVKKEYYLTDQEKRYIIDLAERGKSTHQIAAFIDRAVTTVARFIKKNSVKYTFKNPRYIEVGEHLNEESTTLEELQTRIENLEMQIEILIDHIKKQ